MENQKLNELKNDGQDVRVIGATRQCLKML
jgi:hypothetical protein